MSIKKSLSEATQIKLNNQFCFTTSSLAYTLPTQIVYSDIFSIIDAGSSARRSVLDWGLFHVKRNYLSVWKEYKKALKQRNALLKQNATYDNFIPWDTQLNLYAEQLDQFRKEYFVKWEQEFQKVIVELTDVSCSLHYYKGWDKKNTGKDLQTILEDNFKSDKQKTFTQYGSHQADLLIESNHSKARHILSRGQQKIILIALKLAQANLIESSCLFLIDDFSAELDEVHQENILRYLIDNKGQYVITSVHPLKAQSKVALDSQASFVIHNGII